MTQPFITGKKKDILSESNVLIASKDLKQAEAIAKMLRPLHLKKIRLVSSAHEARKILHQKPIDILIINTPLEDSFGNSLALDASEDLNLDVLILVSSKDLTKSEDRLLYSPVLIIQKPINSAFFLRLFRYTLNARHRMNKLIKQNEKLSKRLKNNNKIFQAKLLLIKNLNLTEDEAHRYLQKKAMENRVSPEEMAEVLINLYS